MLCTLVYEIKKRLKNNNLEEKMYITFDGVWGSENISGWVKKIDKSEPRCPVITMDPVVSDELQTRLVEG